MYPVFTFLIIACRMLLNFPKYTRKVTIPVVGLLDRPEKGHGVSMSFAILLAVDGNRVVMTD